MATLTINSLDDGVYKRLRDRARANNRTVEAEARELLEAQAQVDSESEIDREKEMRATIADIFAFSARMKEKYGVQQTDSVATIRAIRDEE
jgi:plasmid stability protein